MEYLTKEDIIFINQKTIKKHGGNFVPPSNLLNESPLDYLVDIIDAEMFGEALYPKISDKAALYMYNIISNHVFQDGNKRTGLGSALLFLKLNDYQLQEALEKIVIDDNRFIPAEGSSTTEILIAFTLELASGILTLENCKEWFTKNIEKVA